MLSLVGGFWPTLIISGLACTCSPIVTIVTIVRIVISGSNKNCNYAASGLTVVTIQIGLL